MGIVLVVLIVLAIIFVAAIRSAQEKRQAALMQAFDPTFIAPALQAPGGGNVRARGLVLAASQQSTAMTSGGQRYEQRYMTIEVEIPGESPYVMRGSFLLPRGLVEGIPGSSLELSVNRSNSTYLSILGPGGFTGPWIQRGPPRPY